MAEEFIEGGEVFVYGADAKHFGHVKSSSIKMSAESKSISSKDIPGGWGLTRPGKKSLSISVSGLQFIDAASAELLDTDFVISTFIAGTTVPVKYKPKTTSRKFISAIMWISEVSLEDPEDGESTFSMTLSLYAPPSFAVATV